MRFIINRDDSRRTYAAESFDNVYEFIRALELRPINKVFASKSREDLYDMLVEPLSKNGYWSGARTYADSMRTFRNGYSEGVDILRCRVKHVVDTTPRPRNIDAIVGDVPNVPNLVKGIPTNMIYRKRMKVEVHQCTIYYDRAAMSTNKAQEIADAAAKVLNVVATLEAKGVRVALNIVRASYVEHFVSFCIVNVKKHNAPMNLLKISYPAVHTAFYRRQMFHWMESSPIITDKDFLSYGAPFSSMCATIQERRDLIASHGIIKPCDIYLDFGFVSSNDVDSIVSYIESESNTSRS